MKAVEPTGDLFQLSISGQVCLARDVCRENECEVCCWSIIVGIHLRLCLWCVATVFCQHYFRLLSHADQVAQVEQNFGHKLSKTLGNINVDWHNLILSRLCKLDTCAIDDKILSTDWQLSCWECGLAAQLLRAACINFQGRKIWRWDTKSNEDHEVESEEIESEEMKSIEVVKSTMKKPRDAFSCIFRCIYGGLVRKKRIIPIIYVICVPLCFG